MINGNTWIECGSNHDGSLGYVIRERWAVSDAIADFINQWFNDALGENLAPDGTEATISIQSERSIYDRKKG